LSVADVTRQVAVVEYVDGEIVISRWRRLRP
jgi:hypothetical protein